MRLLIRADASTSIGFGHIMRCLTLADMLRSAGVECAFACCELPGNAISMLRKNGYKVFVLTTQSKTEHTSLSNNPSMRSEDDAHLTRITVNDFGANWLLVDHYALDIEWERAVATTICQLS